MSLALRILDRVALKPTREPIDPEHRQRLTAPAEQGIIEVWRYDHVGLRAATPVVALKFPGAGGRAERAGPHPFDSWPETSATIWAVNPPGYGGSGGRASLAHACPTAFRVWQRLQELHPGQRPLVVGNSLGCSAALYLAARFPVRGVLVRNPVPLKELIESRHAWWNAGWITRWLIAALPPDLDPVVNASRCTAPAVFFQSAADRLVPTRLQDAVIAAYAGPQRVFVAPELDHHDVLPEQHQADYRSALDWLRGQAQLG
jgi:pimeloyl-ACP methyl ester carboxylesterase